MNYRLLGPLEVRATDGPLPLGGVKQRALLALLLLNANRVGPARAADRRALGRASRRRRAVKAVQGYVSRLRKLLPDGMLVTRAPGYVLEVEPERSTSRRFERLVAEARTADPDARRRACCARRSGCGAGRRSPSSARSRSRASRRAGSRSCGWRRSRSGSRPTSRSAGTPSSSASSRR